MSPLQPQWSTLPQGRRYIWERNKLVLLEQRLQIYKDDSDENTSCWILEFPGTRFLKHVHAEQLCSYKRKIT
jgi:hypothetical protein